MNSITPITAKQHFVTGWTVVFADGPVIHTVNVNHADLPVPAYVTEGQIYHVARLLVAPPKPPVSVHRKLTERTEWSVAHSRCQQVANDTGLDVDQLVELLPDAHAMLINEWESRELAKQAAHRMIGMTVREIHAVDESYRDYSAIESFDTFSRSLAYERSELGFDPDICCERVWELLHEPMVKRPGRYSPVVLGRAAQMLADRFRGETIFAEWSGDSIETSDLADSEFVPF